MHPKREHEPPGFKIITRSGHLREIYFRQDRDEAVLILECTDEAQARQLLDSLPLVRAGLIEFEIIPLVPYPGFERLFGGTL